MKVTFSFFLIFVLFSGVVLSYNDHVHSNVLPKWGKHTVNDSDGTLSAAAWIRVDVDWFTEPEVRRGVEYAAYADISGSADWGTWNLYAYTPNESDTKDDPGFHGVAFDQAQAIEFVEMDDVDNVFAVNELSSCYGSGGISGTSSGVSYNSVADAWNFPTQ